MMLGLGEAELVAARALVPSHWPQHLSGDAERWTLVWLSCSVEECSER